MIGHIWGLFTNPGQEWIAIRDRGYTSQQVFFRYVIFLALIAPICGFIGTTQIGWLAGTAPAVKLSLRSASVFAMLYYMALLVGVAGVGAMIHWMARTYCEEPKTFDQCVVVTGFAGTPLFLLGFIHAYPVLWVNLLFGMLALAFQIRLLYTGVPIIMQISEDRGFLFSSAVLGVGLVALVAFLATTVILWGIGLAPEFVAGLPGLSSA
ncbi:MAG: YIP1 family protein [Gammaproteobacteria bacterium]|jgi:hypothetical protein|nr:YIP1 family protein [Gammaproteobacteria bacterium]